VLGAVLLPAFAVSLVSGVAIFGLGFTDPAAAMPVIFVHVYVGLFSIPVLLAKVVAGVGSWRRRSGPLPTTGTVAIVGLLATVGVLYGSGTMMSANVTPGGNAVYKQVHLYSGLAALPFLTYHLVAYLGRAVRVGRNRLLTPPPEGAPLSRARFLQLVSVGLVGTWAVSRLPTRLGGDLREADPNDFPITITAGGDDQPDPSTWRLRISGAVAEPFELSLADLERYPVTRATYDLDCVIGWSVTREWGGVSVIDLIEAARPTGEVLEARFVSTTGYESVLPLARLEQRGTMVAREVDGVPLTTEHGYPGRLMAPDVIGEECVKWLAEIEVVSA
jgi:hypothetical protein